MYAAAVETDICTPGDVQAAVPAFFLWLSPRLASVRVLNVECRVVTSTSNWDHGSRWVWPARARLAPPPPTDGAAPLCAVRLVMQPAHYSVNAQSWLSSVAAYYQQLTALCLRGFDVLVLPVMPQLRVLVFGKSTVPLSQDLLESMACQPSLVSLQLIGRLIDKSSPACLEPLRALARLTFLRLDLSLLKDISFFQHMALPKCCSAALHLADPAVSFSRRTLHKFSSLKDLCIEWHEHRVAARLTSVFAALPNTVERVDITYPMGFKLSSQLKLPLALKALRLRADGHAYGQKPLCISMHAGMQRLTLQLWGGHVVFLGHRPAYQSLTNVHLEAATISLGKHLGTIMQARGQLTTRVPDTSEIYHGGGGQLVQVAHMGPWPPSMPGYKGPDVPEARACCYWPCTCGACESCCKADFWRAPGSD